jgi:hypothetical protein
MWLKRLTVGKNKDKIKKEPNEIKKFGCMRGEKHFEDRKKSVLYFVPDPA